MGVFKKKWGQLWCLHFWCRGYAITAEYGKGYLYRYHCTECDKAMHRWSIYGEPISGIIRTPWEEYKKKDPRYNLSPPIIPLNKDISDYLE